MSENACHAQDVREILSQWEVDPDRGLGDAEIEARREKYGPNRLKEHERTSSWRILLEQFKSVVILVLVSAAVVAGVTAHWPEMIAVLAVVFVNAGLGYFTERQAIRSMEALQAMDSDRVTVLRGGQQQEIEADQIVPGDIVLLSGEDVVSADLRIIEADNLRASEAALTGESAPVAKQAEPVEADAPLAERASMLYRGTSLAEGRVKAIAVATGMQTELGKISQMAEEAESSATPLQNRLDQLGQRMALVVLVLAVLIAGLGVLSGREAFEIVTTAVALGVAAVPEGLPIVATIALARGMYLMAGRNALVKRLASVETLGATRVIFTDKTGTLTENQMTLRRVITPAEDRELRVRESDDGQFELADPPEHELTRRAIQIGALCNNAALGDEEEDSTGEPTELALIQAATACGMPRPQLLEDTPEEREVSFDSDVMMMATYHRDADDLVVAVKGAPDAVLEVCTEIVEDAGEPSPLTDEQRDQWKQRAESLASEGLRLLAVAEKQVADVEAEPYENLRFLGLLGLLDPPRTDVRDALEKTRAAGMHTVMVTGDQPATARAIGREVGVIASDEEDQAVHGRELTDLDSISDEEADRLLKTRVFARVSPEQKLNLVTLYQERGEVVAMTGDGVNDAPALKKADIGVAMGRRGTDAAKQVADMVLQDDSFATIVAAVQQGRIIFANIRRSVMFMLCTNFAEVFAVAAASFAGLVGLASLLSIQEIPIPLTALQILYLNVLTDVFPALALGVSAGSAQVMREPPRDPEEPILTRKHWLAVVGWSFLIGSLILGVMLLCLAWLDFEPERAVTVSFLTLAFGKLWFVYNLRGHGAGWFDNDIFRNPWMWGSWALCIVLLLLAVYWPPLAGVLGAVRPGWQGWAVVAVGSLIPLLVGILAPQPHFHADVEE